MTPPQYAKAFPSASRETQLKALNARVEERIRHTDSVTPAQFATLLRGWALSKLR